MIWSLSNGSDPRARELADRHYSRQKPGTDQFVPPGRCVVLYATTATGRAYWVTSWPFAEYVMHQWRGAWMCSAFRNESAGLASEMIRQAVAATRAVFGDPPALGMVTFVDPRCVRPKRDPGRCFIRAGFRPCGATKAGLSALQLLPDERPPASMPVGATADLFSMGDAHG